MIANLHLRPPEHPVAEIAFCVQGVTSPLLSNLYLSEVDRMLERAREVTRNGKYTYVEYARFADDLVVLIDAYCQATSGIDPLTTSKTDPPFPGCPYADAGAGCAA